MFQKLLIFLIFVSFCFCGKEAKPLLPAELQNLGTLLQETQKVHESLLQSESIPDLTALLGTLAKLESSGHPDLQALFLTKSNLESPSPNLDAFYEKWADYSEKAKSVLPLASESGTYSVFYCPMVKKTWIAQGKAVQNPYAPEMRDCGERLP